MNKPKRHIYKDQLDRFEPLTDEEQKDLLFILLDFMDFFEEKMEKAKTVEEKEKFFDTFSDTQYYYQFFAAFFMKDRSGAREKEILLADAHRSRLEYENVKKEKKE